MQCQTRKEIKINFCPSLKFRKYGTFLKNPSSLRKSDFCGYIKILNLNLYLSCGSVGFYNIAFLVVSFAG